MNAEKIIAAVRTDEDFDTAAASDVKNIFMLDSNILTMAFMIKKAHEAGKKIFIHVDFAEGIGKDKYGLMFLKQCGADGIITTRTGLVRLAREIGLFSIQRFFVVDSHSVKTMVESAKASRPDMLELMPCMVTKIISGIKESLGIPIIAGGLVETDDEAAAAIDAGAEFVSVSDSVFWNRKI